MKNKVRVLSKKDVKKCLDMKSTIEAMKIAFGELSNKNIDVPLRTNISFDENSGGLFMPVYFPSMNLVGIKSVMIHKENPLKNLPMIQATYQIFDSETGNTLALMDGEYLTAMRTGAASGLATDLLASTDASVAVIFGAGVQAEKQIEAICCVRDIEIIYISDPNIEKVKRLIKKLKNTLNVSFRIMNNVSKLKDVDILCTATSSSNPVFNFSNIKKGVHINGIGSYKPDMCEIPHEAILNGKIYVDSVKACLTEAGDLIQPIQKGIINKNHIFAELGEVINGKKIARKNKNEITIFKSVGNAIQDIVAAELVLRKAEKLNVGSIINL